MTDEPKHPKRRSSFHQGTVHVMRDTYEASINSLGGIPIEQLRKDPRKLPSGIRLQMPDGTVVLDTTEEA